MKSIIEESSSIIKAIEKAWTRAGQPQEFSVKVFEEAQRGFFGLTKKNAKVGLFFAETEEPTPEKARVAQQQRRPEKVVDRRPERIQEKPVVQEVRETDATIAKQDAKKDRRSAWTDEMVNDVETWVVQLLQRCDIGTVPFTLSRTGNRLHINFARMIMPTEDKNTALFRSLSYLLLGMLRSRFKKEFRFLKVVLTAE